MELKLFLCVHVLKHCSEDKSKFVTKLRSYAEEFKSREICYLSAIVYRFLMNSLKGKIKTDLSI